MARPRKDINELRTEVVRFLVRPGELAAIHEAAVRAGFPSLSAYARSLVIDGRVIVRQSRALDFETYDQLRRIGINLNQAVAKLNATGKTSPQLDRAAQAVERFIAEHLGDGS